MSFRVLLAVLILGGPMAAVGADFKPTLVSKAEQPPPAPPAPQPPTPPTNPKIDGPAQVDPYKIVRMNLSGVDPKAGTLWSVDPDQNVDWASQTNGMGVSFVAPPGAYTVECILVVINADNRPLLSRVKKIVTIGVPVPPPPGPPGPNPPPPGPNPPPPGPNPPPPQPEPVKSLRVIYVINPTTNLTSGEVAAIYGQAVRDWLAANTTSTDGGSGIWRATPTAPSDNLSDTWKALWMAVKPKITSDKCVVIEVNGKATIEPLPGSAADMINLLNKYKGGK